MPFLTVDELSTHIKDEIMDVISTSDDNKPQAAIDAAIAEVKGYLSNYDSAATFAAAGANRNPILLLYTKDIAVWHYIQLANPNIDITLRERRYELATKWLDKVQSGRATPDLPPLVQPTDLPVIGKLQYGSNAKRITGY